MRRFGLIATALAVLILWSSNYSIAIADDISGGTPGQSGQSEPLHQKDVKTGVGKPLKQMHHEQEWIVDSIVRDIAEMMLYAAKHNGDTSVELDTITLKTAEVDHTKFDVSLGWNKAEAPENTTVTLTGYLWSPANYSPWASQLLKRLKLESSNSKESQSDALMSALSDYSPEVIAAEEKKLSTNISDHPLDPAWHEKAALLCTTLGLRESAACFTDLRTCLNRIASHLAFAKALRGGADFGDDGKLAEIGLTAMCCRTAESVEHAKAMESRSNNDAMQSWLRALKLRATNDYRIADLPHARIAERLEYCRSLANNLRTDALTEFVQKELSTAGDKRPGIDWLRVGVRGIRNVESGHMFAEPGVQAEMSDFVADYKLFHDEPLKADPINELNLEPTRCLVHESTWQLEPLSWSCMAAFHARHLCDSVFQRYHFEKELWGVPEAAQATMDYGEKAFSKLRLYPLAELSMLLIKAYELPKGTHFSDPELSAKIGKLISEHPEEVNVDLWKSAESNSPPGTIPKLDEWLVPRFPMGTAYDFEFRDNFQTVSMAEHESMRALDPYSNAVAYWLVRRKYGDHPTGDQLVAGYGPMLDYDVSAMWAVSEAYANQPAKRSVALEKLAHVESFYCFMLARCYLELGQTEKAVGAYEDGINRCPDSVLVSNNCSWLCKYYFDHNQKEKALKLAKQAAEVYSQTGLCTLARVYERMGKLADAERYFILATERYDDNADLCQFYLRHLDNAQYKSKAENISTKAFPRGVKKLRSEDLAGAPNSGARIKTESDLTRKYGLKIGDVFVGVDGYKVGSELQYRFVRNIDTDGSNLEVVVWNGKEYKTIKATLPNKKFGCEIVDYSKN